jgi:hypothetical protein
LFNLIKYLITLSPRATEEYNLAVLFPELLSEWDYEKNEKKPNEYAPYSGKKVWWECEKGHSWEAVIKDRSKGSGCPYCSGSIASEEYNLAILFPELIKEWHPTKNRDLSPEKVTPGSDRKVWWICDKGHEWEQTVHDRTRPSPCPMCYRERKNN